MNKRDPFRFGRGLAVLPGAAPDVPGEAAILVLLHERHVSLPNTNNYDVLKDGDGYQANESYERS